MPKQRNIKICPPNVTGVVKRERLFALLDQPDARMIWLNAPAGSGKTTLVASFIESANLPCLWYQVDTRDNDPSTFFHYLSDAAHHIGSRRHACLLPLTPEYLLNFKLFTLRYFEILFDLLPVQSCIVIDNYQDLPGDSPLHAAILSLLEHASASALKIMIISREEPPEIFARLLANDTFLRIGWQELQLDLHESEQLIRSKNPELASETLISRMQHLSDGWAAGLVLLAHHAKQRDADFSVPSSRARTEIFNYFASQILSTIDRETERLLLETSLVSRFSSSMAREITGLDAAPKIISALCRSNFFITGHHSVFTCYQYHPLFREFLIERTEASLTPEALRQLRRRSADSSVGAGLTGDAMFLYIHMCDWDSVSSLLNANAERLINQGRQETVLAWLSAIPRPIIEETACFLFWESACMVTSNTRQANLGFESAANIFLEHNEISWALLALVSTIDICFISFEFTPLDCLITRVEQLLSVYDLFETELLEYRVTMSLFNALSVRQPGNPNTPQWGERAIHLLRTRTEIDSNLRVRCSVNVITYFVWSGDMVNATSLISMLRDIMCLKELSELNRIMALNVMAIYSMMCDLPAIPYLVEEGLQLAEKTGLVFLDSHLASTAVVAALSRGDLAAAENYLKKMEGSLSSSMRFNPAIYSLVTSWKYLLSGDASMALQYQLEALRLVREIGWKIIEPVFLIGVAIACHAAGDDNAALDNIRTASAQSVKNNSKLNHVACLLAEAEICFSQQRDADGIALLAEALPMWRETGNNNFIWWRPAVMAELLGRALDAAVEVEFVCSLIRKRGLAPHNPITAPDCWPWKIRIITLGRFHIEKDGSALLPSGKVQKKPLELLKAVIALGSENVPAETLCDALWPDADGDTASSSLATTLFRLRQLLECDQALQLSDGCISLDRRYVWVDVWGFERAVAEARTAWEQSGDTQRALACTEKARGLYGGDFLPAERDRLWSFTLRERLKQKYIFKMEDLCAFWEQGGEIKRAIRCYHEALEVDCLAEEFYQQLMQCLHRDGQDSEALKVYERCRTTLAHTLGIPPSRKTEEIVRQVLDQSL